MPDITEKRYPFELPPLPYAYDALEPYIDAETMEYHHDKHFKKYIDTLNDVLADYPALQKYTLRQLLENSHRLPQNARERIVNNAGGVYNHDLFFAGLSIPGGSGHEPHGTLRDAIIKAFGSVENFEDEFVSQALEVFGSGYATLAVNRRGELNLMQLKNQETVLAHRASPIILLDVWEHAYYLKYKNARADYVAAIMNVIAFPNID